MMWQRTNQSDLHALALANRHYSRVKPNSHTMMPPGRQIVLITATVDAVWGVSWPRPEYVGRRWFPDSWLCTIFRNEGSCLSSDLIRQAVAVTRAIWGVPPESGMVTIVDPRKVRHKRDPGRCFRKAGFVPAGFTKEEGLLLLRLAPEDMPEPCLPDRVQLPLLWEAASANR